MYPKEENIYSELYAPSELHEYWGTVNGNWFGGPNDYYNQIMMEELNKIKELYGEDKYNDRKFSLASQMFLDMISGEMLDEFLTLPAYKHI